MHHDFVELLLVTMASVCQRRSCCRVLGSQPNELLLEFVTEERHRDAAVEDNAECILVGGRSGLKGARTKSPLPGIHFGTFQQIEPRL